jgi:hypothetical protein
MTHWRVTASGTLPAGDIFVTGLQIFRVSGGSTAGLLAAWLAAFELFWNGTGASDDYKSLCKTTLETTQLTATQIGDDNKNIDQAIATVALAGTATDDSMPGSTCPVLSLRTANASKRGRGRCYFPCVTEASNAGNGRIESASATQIATAGQAMIQSLNGASYEVVVWHQDLLAGDPVIAIDVADLFRQQRRRQNRDTVTRVRLSV